MSLFGTCWVARALPAWTSLGWDRASCILVRFRSHTTAALHPRNKSLEPVHESDAATLSTALVAGTDRVAGRAWRIVRNQAEVFHVLEVWLPCFAGLRPFCLILEAGPALNRYCKQEGSAARATACTALNEHSSRSHAILSVRLQPAALGRSASVLHLVDLAGAACINVRQMQCQQLRPVRQSVIMILTACWYRLRLRFRAGR